MCGNCVYFVAIRDCIVVCSVASTASKAVAMKQGLIDLATEFQKSAGLISFDEANKLWASACDGPGVTATEFATLAHILDVNKFTKKGREYLDKLVVKQSSGSSLYKQINKVAIRTSVVISLVFS